MRSKKIIDLERSCINVLIEYSVGSVTLKKCMKFVDGHITRFQNVEMFCREFVTGFLNCFTGFIIGRAQ